MQIKRYLSVNISKLLLQFPAVLVLGARQVGKTTLCREVTRDWTTIDLESHADYQRLERDPEHFLRLHPSRLLIDEAQISSGLFPALRVAIDEHRDQPGRFLLTGSSSPQLLKHTSESLAGRVGIIELAALKASERFGHPLSSFYSILNSNPKPGDLLHITSSLTSSELEVFFLEGGFPEIAKLPGEGQRQAWMQSYTATYIERDIRRLFPRLNMEAYRLFISMLAQLNCRLINMSDIARSLGVSQPAVREYLEIAHGTLIWRRINSFTRSSVRRVVKMPKGLYRDSGLVNFLSFVFSRAQLHASPLVGWLWEGMVIEEILKGCSIAETPVEPYFYRTSDGREVDLILEGSFGLLPIEIKYGVNISDRDLNPLKTFMREHKLKLGLVISGTLTARQLTDQIVEIPAHWI